MRWLALLLVAACARPIGATLRVPNPIFGASEANYEVAIDIRDLKNPGGLARVSAHARLLPTVEGRGTDLPLWIEPHRFRQSATLTLGGADELRVEVRLSAEWRELVALDEYEISLSDEHGPLSQPETIPRASTPRDYESSYLVWRNFQTVRIHEDDRSVRMLGMFAPDPQYVREEIWRGGGILIFPPRTLRPDTRELTLTLRSRARTLRFTWEFDHGKLVARRP